MAEARQDRRIQRTKLMLRSAMVALIREKGFEALTVQDIIDRADVGRSTFYTHFKSKEDLLKGGVEMMRTSLLPFQRRAHTASGKAEDRLFAFSRELFAHAQAHRDVFAAMVGKRSGTVFRDHLHRMLADLVREDLAVLAPRKKRQRAEIETVVQFVTAGLLGILSAWLEEMSQLTDADLDALFRRMALPAVQAVLG
jgi:AcrR family transcriptional regulator